MINSRAKGGRGEREWCRECIRNGYEGAHRSQQFCGKTGDAPDVIVPGMEKFHPEVKRVEKLQIDKAMTQAIRDAAEKNKIPYVAYKRNRGEWFVIMKADDWFTLIKNEC